MFFTKQRRGKNPIQYTIAILLENAPFCACSFHSGWHKKLHSILLSSWPFAGVRRKDKKGEIKEGQKVTKNIRNWVGKGGGKSIKNKQKICLREIEQDKGRNTQSEQYYMP